MCIRDSLLSSVRLVEVAPVIYAPAYLQKSPESPECLWMTLNPNYASDFSKSPLRSSMVRLCETLATVIKKAIGAREQTDCTTPFDYGKICFNALFSSETLLIISQIHYC